MFSFAPLSRILPYWPSNLFGDPGGLLDEVGVTDFEIQSDDTQLTFTGTAAWLEDIEIKVPEFDALSIAFLSTGGFTQVPFALQLAPAFQLSLTNLDVTLRLRSEFLKPVHQDSGGKWVPTLDGNGDAVPAEIVLVGITATVGADGDIDVTGAPTLSLPPLEFGNTGIVLKMSGINLYLSKTQTPDSFKGLTASSAMLYLSGGLGINHTPYPVTFTDLRIGSSGFSGEIEADWTASFVNNTLSGTGVGELFGVPFAIKSLSLKIQQNVPTGASIKGLLVLPFFNGAVDVNIGFGPKGELSVGIDATGGLTTLSIPNVLDIELDSLKFEVNDGELTTKLSGKLTPTFSEMISGDINWPSFDVKELEIDSKGHVKLSGGWLDLPKQYSLDFHGFKVEITKFGFGRNDNGTKWIGMSGGVELVKGLPAGASVKGLRITANEDWSHPKISFEGVGVELETGVLYFKGEVDYREFPDPDDPSSTVHRFDGDIRLKLEAIDLEIDGTLVAGSADGYNFFALYVEAELPTGIPVGPSGVALYGLAGLLAIQMGPKKTPDQKWYDWYRTPSPGIENLKAKWKNIKDSRAFGAGVTIGTFEDNGYTFNGRVLLALILPGPIIVMQGMANILKERAKLSDVADPMFRTIAVLDKKAGTMLFGVDATYKYDETNGDLIKINGGLEAFYSFTDPSVWHLYLGINEPRESRIQARVLRLFDAQAYFMLDAHQLAMGSWIGYNKSWQFTKLSIHLEAWMENNAIVSFKPAHLYGDLWVHGSVLLKVFRFGAGLDVDARIEADVFKPFHLLGDFKVGIRLPRPLKNISVDISLEWGPDKIRPQRPIVFKEAAIEHLKSSVKWPLPVGVFVFPNYDDGSGFLLNSVTVSGDIAPPPPGVPSVPMDCRPSVSFARNVWDDALVGIVVQPLNPEWERIGDPSRNQGPAKMRYGLRSVRLDKYVGTSWTTVASAAGSVAASAKLFGSWSATAAIGGTGPAQNKFLLWSKSGLDQFRNTSADWGSHFGKFFRNYPCFSPPGPSRVCLDFEKLKPFSVFSAPFAHPDYNGVSISIISQALSGQKGNMVAVPTIQAGAVAAQNVSSTTTNAVVGSEPGFIINSPPEPIHDKKTMLCPTTKDGLRIDFAKPANAIRIITVPSGSNTIKVYAVDASGTHFGPFAPIDDIIEIVVADVMSVTLASGTQVCLIELCAILAPSDKTVALYQDMGAHNQNATALWSGVGNVLEPYTQYRLRFETSVETADFLYDATYNTTLYQYQYAYFQTGGPPGVGMLSVPSNANEQNFDSGLDDLTLYVERTVPPIVPAAGQKPLSPRPVYRGYDVGVVFNENYVSLMYRMAGRDLNLLLFDRNNLPVRDRAGRLVVTENPWDKKTAVTLSAIDQQWASILNASTCRVRVDTSLVQHDETMTAGAEDQLLDPDALYEARLVPSLMHEDFGKFAVGEAATGGQLGRWGVADDPAITGGPSHWTIEAAANPNAHRVTQTSATAPSASGGSNPAPAGTMLVLGNFFGLASSDKSQPGQWTDYRLSLYLRSSLGAAIGAAFRHSSPNTYYLFVMDRTAPSRRLVRVNAGVATVLAQDAFVYDQNRDYHLVIEALGASLRVYIDDVVVFVVNDSAISGGGMALYCSGGAGAAFSDIQAHDFSLNTASVYKFSFTTSPFVNFFHHLHSFDDGCWASNTNISDTDLGKLIQKSVSDISSAITDDEARAFESFAADVLGPAALQEADQVEILKVERAGTIAALFVRSPQPFGFARNSCELWYSPIGTPTAISPMSAKLVAATLGAAAPADEHITILIRQPLDLSGYRIEKRDYSAVISGGGVIPLEELDEVTSQWNTIFVFPSAEEHDAGTSVVIYSCSADNAPQAEPRTVQYFRAASGNPGALVLNDSVVDLRLVSPDGDVLHARRFQRDNNFNLLSNCRLLRKADETAFVVFPAGTPGQSFAEGSYRLHMQYRRDNTANDPASVVMTECGEKTPEVITLEFSSKPFA